MRQQRRPFWKQPGLRFLRIFGLCACVLLEGAAASPTVQPSPSALGAADDGAAGAGRSGFSSLQSYVPVSEKSRVSFALPYTMGTHEGVSTSIEGEAVFDATKGLLKSAQFRVPIASLKAGNRKLECHLQESLGLDYSVSDFPDSHVCDGDERLPTMGKNAIRFPWLELELGSTPFTEKRMELQAAWTIHGVRRVQTLTVTWSKEDSAFRVQATFPVQLEDYGIVVKKFLFVKVDPVTKVSVDLLLRAK